MRLSDKKVLLYYDAPLICEEKELEIIHLRVRYKLDVSDGVYKMIYPKDHFLNLISNRMRVKKKFIHYGSIFFPSINSKSYMVGTNQSFEFDGMKFNNLIKSIYITDTDWYKVWNRDQQLNELLK